MITYTAQMACFGLQWYVYLIVAATIVRNHFGCEMDRNEGAPQLFGRKAVRS